MDYSRVVHGEQRFLHHRPVHPGDVLTMTSRVADIRDAGRNEIMVVVSEITAADGERVATLTSSAVSRGTAGPGAGGRE
jgi:acyl dehydratase